MIEAGGVANGIAGTPTATGTLTDTDVDNTANTFQAVTTATRATSGYGSYTVDCRRGTGPTRSTTATRRSRRSTSAAPRPTRSRS